MEPVPKKKISGAGAEEKWLGSATPVTAEDESRRQIRLQNFKSPRPEPDSATLLIGTNPKQL